MRHLALLLLLTSPALAADLAVPPGGSIQAVIDSAVPGDRVLVPPGTYLEQLDFKGKAIDVIGLDGAAATTVDAGFAGSVVTFRTGEGPASRLVGLTLTGGNGGYGGGGGIGCGATETPTITDCVIRGNSGKLGAGVHGSPVMERCVITQNTSSLNHGGGLYGAPTLRSCVVAGNTCTSADGGGLYVAGGTAVVQDSVIAGNKAVFANSHGGGIYVDSSGDLQLSGSLVLDNSATGGVFAGYGGGLRVESAGTTVSSCTFVGNIASGSSTFGGAIYGPADVTNSIIRDSIGGEIEGATVTWSNVAGGYPGVGNVDLPTGFVDAAGGDYHLDHGSAMVDLGDPAVLDPDGTVVDLGAFRFATLYARANTLAADWAAPTWGEVPALLGGKVRMRVLAGPGHAGEAYWIFGTTSGSTPGFDLLGAHLPLNFDAYTLLTLTQPNSPGLTGFLGTLDGQGRADAVLGAPADPSGSLVGALAEHAALVGIPGVTVVPLVTSSLPVPLQ